MSSGVSTSAPVGDRRLLAWIALGLAFLAPGFASEARGQFGNTGEPLRAATSVYFDTSNAADALLRSASNHVRGGHYAEAVEIYQRVIQQFGDKVVETNVEPTRPDLAGLSQLSIDVRRECQQRIAALPPEARALYRARVDGQAERWFRQGAADRDKAPLRRVIDQAFCSSWGDDALELMGDLAFQDGRMGEALAHYTRLVPDPSEAKGALVHPDPSIDLARVEAKKLLVRAAINDDPPSPGELDAFGKAHPDTPGPFAGRRGPLAQDLIEAIRDDHLALPATPDGRWPTFAGSPTRTRVATHPIDVGSLQWKVDLEPITISQNRQSIYMRIPRAAPPPISPERLLASHPIVVGDQVVIEDNRQIVAYNLNSRPAEAGGPSAPPDVAWKVEKFAANSPPPLNRGYPGLARFTLTAVGDRVYARVGPPPSTIPMVGRNGAITVGPPTPSEIVAIDRTSNEKRVAWRREASEIDLPKRRADGAARNVVFAGTPVADDRRVYVAMTDRVEMTAAYVACLDSDTGTLRWIRSVCESSGNGGDIFGMGGARPEVGLRLLTLDGSTLYFQTNLGAVAALDAETGAVRWLATYPTRRAAATYDHELNPAIVHDGLVIVAPNDAQAIYAFDALSGRMAWKTDDIPEDIRLAHVLGVCKGKLVATGDRVLLYDVKTGKLANAWPENNQATQGFGRGVLAGDRIYWPTRNEIHVLDAATGLRSDPPIRLQETFGCEGGNLAVGDGYLLVAQSNALVVFCQTSRLIERYKVEIARAPERAINYYRLAQVAEATGRDEEALASLAMIPERVRPAEAIDGHPLADLTRDHQRRLLMKLGVRARAGRDWAEATRRFEAAAEASRTDRDRLAARLELADVQGSGDHATESVKTLQTILGDDRLRNLSIETPEGNRSVRADLLVADRLANLIRVGGRDLYATYDRDAAALLQRGQRDRDPRLIEDVGRSYPVAQVVPEAWLTLARLSEERSRFAEAARAYKKLLAVAPDDASRARALWGLAHAYEGQKLWVSARDVYLDAAARFADQTVDLGDTAAKLGPAIAERLTRDPFEKISGEQARPKLVAPLRRRWDIRPASEVRPLAADGVPPTAGVGRVFLAQGRTIRPVDPLTGTSTWVRDLEAEPVWVGYLADRLIAATGSSLVAVNLETGTVDWRRDIAPVAPAPGADPFGRGAIAPADGEERKPSGNLSGFRIVGNRVYCLQGDHTLLAHDGDTGLLDWSYTPPAGAQINSKMLVATDRIVVQVRKPNRTLVLDPATGRRLGDFAADKEDAWPVDPLALDADHVAIVVDRASLARLDLNSGVKVWTLQLTPGLPKNGPLRLLGDAERLLVLDGRELIRVDPSSGAQRWSRSLGEEDLSERPESIALAGDRAFVAISADLKAIDLANGAVAWSRPLLNGPDLGWVVTLVDRGVAAYPDPSRQGDGSSGPLPLAIFRREDGRMTQRFVFPTITAELSVLVSPTGAVVATRGGLWALGDRRVMDAGARPE